MFAIDVPVQAIIVAFAILQEKRRRAVLPGLMAAIEKGRVSVRIAQAFAERVVPAIGDPCQRRVERFTQGSDHAGQRIGEVFVFTAPEAVPAHDDAAAELGVIGIGFGKLHTFIGVE